jgi:hypothetical protein
MAYDNTNSGMLAKNERMREGKNDPGYTGFVNIDGKEYWLKAWVKQGREGSRMEGKSFFSLSLDPKDDDQGRDRGGRGNDRGGNRGDDRDRGGNRSNERPARSSGGNRAPQQEQRGGFDDMDDDIPF